MQRDIESLVDIVQAAKHALTFTSGQTAEQFYDDAKSQFAVVRAFEIIGEAANRVSIEFQEAHPEVPWAEMVGMRNKMIHEYDDVDLAIVWDTLQHDIPNLIKIIEPLIS